MKYLLVFLMLFGTAYGQCIDTTPADTCTNNSASLITYNSARINATIPTVTVTTLTLVYVRTGHTDTAYATGSGASALRNITGLTAGTQYKYYYSTYCPPYTWNQHHFYTFTTTSNTIAFTPQFNYYQYPGIKIDSILLIPKGDTDTRRAPTTSAQIRYRSADNKFYGYYPSCVCWRPLATDSAGIIALLDGKVDSVTVSGDSLFYWKVGVSYGYILPSVATVWHTTGNAITATPTDFIGTTDATDFVIKTNGTQAVRINTTGALGFGSSVDYGTSGYVPVSNGSGSPPTWTAPASLSFPINGLRAATASNDIDNTTRTQTWRWNSFTSNALILAASNTTASPGQTLFGVNLDGANAAASRITYASSFTNGHTGTTSTNIAVNGQSTGAATANYAFKGTTTGTATNNYTFYADASGGTNNYGLYVATGDVNLQPQTASRFVTLDANKNIITSAVASSILAASITDEVGTDKVVFNTSPSFVTSVIGGASFDVFNTTSTTINAFGAATALTIGGATTTAVTHNYSTNATAAATTKTVNLGTGGAASSTTNINIGSANGGTTTINSPTVAGTIFNAATGFRIGGAAASRKMLVGNATNFVASTETWATPGTSGNILLSDGTNWTSSASSALPFWALSGTSAATGNMTINVGGNDLTVDIAGTLNMGNGSSSYFKLAGDVAYIQSASIAGGHAGDYITLIDNATGELGVTTPGPSPFAKYFEEKNGGLWVKDSYGNKTLISPHPKGAKHWTYESTNEKTGVTTTIDMIKLAQVLEKMSGEKLIYTTKKKK